MANRTKNKPANSEQAARLLGQQPVFLSFDDASRALLSNLDSSPPLASESGITFDIDPDYETIFRHLSKKDSNTKLKALQDFIQVSQTKDAETLEKTANYWQRIYRKLSNSTDSKIRLEAHIAHKSFIEKLNRETLLKSYQIKSDDFSFSKVSFQKLVTLPAVLWTACHEQSTQSAEASRQIMNFLYPSPEERLQFLIDNYVSILNYTVYTLFHKIPVDLFYSSPLSKDAKQVFDEHLLVTSFMGLSMLINEFLSAEDKQSDCQKCLRNIFTVINREFMQSKEAFIPSPKSETISSDASKSHEKKKNKKKDNSDNGKYSEEAKGFKFWTYEKVENFSVRTAFYSFLNSFTRLTTQLLQDSDQARPDSDGTILWFKLYKTLFLNKVFFAFSDSVSQVRGHAWLLISHILLNHEEYKPWAVVSHDKWRKDILLPFIQNGCKPREGIMDFGLINIVNKAVYPEFFVKKFPHQSAFKMICDSYSLTNVIENVKLITFFTDAYQQSFDPNKEDVYFTIISAFNVALSKAFLLSDAKFLVEVYYNLIYHFVLRNFSSEMNDFTSKKFHDIFQNGIKTLIIDSFHSSKDILSNSHLYLNLLVLIRNVGNDFKQNSNNYSQNVYELFKTNILRVYSEILSYISYWNNAEKDKKSSDNIELKNYLKCLNFLFFLQHDGYFSCEYYYLRSGTDYTKNFMNIFKSRCATESIPKEKKVQFQVEDDSNDCNNNVESCSEDTAFGHVSLFNPSFSDFKSDSKAFLPDDFHSILDKFSITIAVLCRKFDEMISDKIDEKCIFILYHLQYYFRIFDFYTEESFFRQLNVSNLNQFIELFLIKWISSVVRFISNKKNFTSLKLEMTILQKVFDCILILAPNDRNNQQFWNGLFEKMDSFAFILFVEHLEKLKRHPFSVKYEQKLAVIRSNIDQAVYARALRTEIEKFNSDEVTKIQMISLAKLLTTYLEQANNSANIEEAFNMFCDICRKDCFNMPVANWFYSRLASQFHKIIVKIDSKQINNLDQFSSDLSLVVEYFLDKCFNSSCTSDFTSDQFEIIFNFLDCCFKMSKLFISKFSSIIVNFFKQIFTTNFYRDQSSTLGNMDRLEFMEKIFNSSLGSFKQLPECAQISQKIFYEFLSNNTVQYCNDSTPILFATEGDDAEAKILSFYQIFLTDKFPEIFSSNFMENIKFEQITNHFEITYFYFQSLILNRFLVELIQDKLENLLDNPSGTILESLKILFKVHFYFEQSLVMPSGQNASGIDKQKMKSNNIEFGFFIEQLNGCIETLTRFEPDLKMKLFSFLVDIKNQQFDNVLFAFFLNQNFFFLEFSEFFESHHMTEDHFGVFLLNFFEDRNYKKISPLFKKFFIDKNSEEIKYQDLSVEEHKKMLLLSCISTWETSESENDPKIQVKNIISYIKIAKVIEFVKNHPEDKIIAILFARLLSELVNNSLQWIKEYQMIYDMNCCLIERIQECIYQKTNCLDVMLSSRILKALIDSNHIICKQTSQLPILDWKMFSSNIANNVILKIVYQMRQFTPTNFLEDIFVKRICNLVEWYDGQTLRLAKQIQCLNVQVGDKLELEAKLDGLISEKKLQPSSSKVQRKNMLTGSEYHDNILSLYFSLLFHPNLNWTLSAYYVLSKTLQDLNRILPDDSTNLPQDSGDSDRIEDDFLEPFKIITDYFHKLNAAIGVIFDEYEFAEEVLLEPTSELFDYVLTYLLFWKLYLELVESFTTATDKTEKIRFGLVEYVIENNFHETFLDVLFNLMINVEENLDPEDDDYVELFSVENIEETFKTLDNVTRFNDFISMFRGKHISLLPRLAQVVYYQSLKTLPGVVRSWAGKKKRSDRDLIDGFTLKYFTSALISSEYDRFHGEKDFGNVSVRFNKRDKDIFLIYNRNEICLKIKFSFPINYPLAPLNMECLDHSGASDQQTNDWIHRLVVFFSKHNCSIRDGIVMLKPNMDKFFENFEECMICLFMLHGASKELPKLRCVQCRKKFHRTCMERWFHISGNRTCPQCKFEFR